MHDYEKYYPLINKELFGLSQVLYILRNGCGYISIFNLKKLLVLDSNDSKKMEKTFNILSLLLPNLKKNNDYIFLKKPNESDDQMLYEKNRDRILYSIINKHEKENIIFAHSVYYKTIKYNKISLAYLCFDAYSGLNVFQEESKTKSFIVYDFAVDGKYSINEAKSYIERIKKLAKRLSCKIVPICIFEFANQKTINYLRNNAVVILDFKSILGNDYSEFLRRMSLIDKKDYSYDNFIYVLSIVSKYEQFDSIKGGLFEHLCAAMLKEYVNNDSTTIECDFHLKGDLNNRDTAQFDIIIKTFDSRTIICECKAYSTKVLYGESEDYGTLSYFIKQIEKYKNKYKEENVDFIMFGANGFQKTIMNEYNNKKIVDSDEFVGFPVICDIEKLKGNKKVGNYVFLWEKFYLAKN